MLRLLLMGLGLALAPVAVATQPSFHIVPKPQHLQVGSGSFTLDRHVGVAAPDDARAQQIAAFLRHAVKQQTGIRLPVARDAAQARIRLRLDPSIRGEEAYRLRVTPQHIVIRAGTTRGLFWGVQTLRQLLPTGRQARVKIPAVRIDDAPSYPWRGVMLDVARHFQSVDFVKKQIDLMSYYKLNVLHWHLTDDQGWRIQIKRYPKLTSVGAWRTEDDGSRYGGFYTQAQIREVVAYARARNIMVVPEIEMPGHASAAVAAYPELSCSGRAITVPDTWGVFANVACVGKDSSFTFLEHVLDEVIALFPAPYLHIGGDEVPVGAWHDCADCTALQKRHGLQGEAGLHGYFVERIRKYLAGKGRTLIGWDEIMQGGVDRRAVVEVWRGPGQATQALANGNRVLIAGPFYLDAPISGRTLQDLYRNNPFARTDLVAHPGQVLGGEAPLWSEHITPRNVEAMLYPRLLAVSEHLWNRQAHDVADFLRRVRAQHAWWDARQVAYGSPDQNLVDYTLTYHPGYHRWRLRAQRGFDDLHVHYSTDGSMPDADSPAFGNVLDLYVPTSIRVVPYRGKRAVLTARSFRIVDNLALGKPLRYATAPSAQYSGGRLQLVNGLLGSTDFHDGRWAGWQGETMDASIDLQKPTEVHAVSVQFLRVVGSWIELPTEVRFQTSLDGTHWQTLHQYSLHPGPDVPTTQLRVLGGQLDVPIRTRYLRVIAEPSKHLINGGTPFVFVSEIIVH